jgi:hypothetical protein
VTENLYIEYSTNGVPPGSVCAVDGRTILHLSDADRRAFYDLERESRKRVRVTDEQTGAVWQIWKISCGAGCRCAAAGRHLS